MLSVIHGLVESTTSQQYLSVTSAVKTGAFPEHGRAGI